MRTCTTCRLLLQDSEFYPRKDTTKLTSECKQCKTKRSYRRYDEFGRYSKYGITKEQYDAQWKKQRYRCALCRTDKPSMGKRRNQWNIDHFHAPNDRPGKWRVTTGDTFRGILCHSCNVGLGELEKFMGTVGYDRVLEYLGSRVNGSLLPQQRRG
jgi:hypothetical protein